MKPNLEKLGNLLQNHLTIPLTTWLYCLSCVWFLLSLFFFFLFLFNFIYFFKFYFVFKLYIIVLVLPNIKMNPPQVHMCSPSWTLLPSPSPYHPSGSSQCTSPKHPVSCIEPGLATRFIHDILHVSMPFSQIFPPSPSLCTRQQKRHWCIEQSYGKLLSFKTANSIPPSWSRKWQPTPVFLPGNSIDRGSCQATVYEAAKSWTWLSTAHPNFCLLTSRKYERQ